MYYYSIKIMKKKYVYIGMLVLVVISLVLVVLDKQPKWLDIIVLLGMAVLLLTDKKGWFK